MAARKNTTAVQAISYYIDHPAEWCEDVLGVQLEPWQRETLTALATDPKKRVSVGSGHGIGKSALEAMAILWFLSTRPNPKVVCTAPTGHQLNDILWPELSKWINKSPALKKSLEWTKTRLSMRGYEERWWAVPVSVSNPESFAGFHEDHILIVVDEASGVDEVIYDVIEGALTTSDARLLICGNPTRTSGQLYEAVYGRLRPLYWHRQVSCFDSSRVSASYPQMIERKYGKDSDVYRVRVLGQPPKAEPDVFIGLSLVEQCIGLEVSSDDMPYQIGVDVARYGDDETVIAVCDAGRVTIEQRYNGQPTTTTANYVVQMARQRSGPVRVVVDDVGVGGGVTDRIRELARDERLPIEVVASNNQARSPDDSYANWGSQAWGGLKELLKTRSISVPDDDDLRGQLTGRKYTVDSKGRIALEPKPMMKKRGLSSPDIADAVVLATAGQVPTSSLLGDVFDPSVHICDTVDLDSFWPRWIGVQATPEGLYALLWLTCDPSGQLYAYDELYFEGALPDLAIRYRRMIGADPVVEVVADPVIFRPDPIDKTRWADQFIRQSIPIQPGSGDVVAGVGELRQALNVRSGRPRLKVSARCTRLLWEIGHVQGDHPESRYMMLSCLWRLLLRRPAWRDMTTDTAYAPLDYPEPDVV